MRGILLASSVAALLGAERPVAQERWRSLVDTWFVAVTTHVPGEQDDAARAIAAWTRSDLETALPYIASLTDIEAGRGVNTGRTTRRMNATEIAHLQALSAPGGRNGQRHNLAIRGAFLHTDVVTLVQRDPQVVAAPRPRRDQSLLEREETTPTVLVRARDGRVDAFELGAVHWDFARRLLWSVDPASDEVAVVRFWYRAAAAYFAHEKNIGEGYPHLQRALQLFPQDPAILLASGCLQERLASSAIQDFVRTTTLPNGLRFLDVDAAETHLARAERAFRRSVEIEPTLVEARLRLGRVLGQIDRHQEAASELEQALKEATDQVVRFYANLFLGDEELALGRVDNARSSYERAIAQFPVAQSARLALSHLERARGDRPAARAVLEPAVTPVTGDDQGDDPWRDYFLGEGRRVRDLFAELYEPFRPPPER
jgi:tetratricopeptide (TPR) repeat protein